MRPVASIARAVLSKELVLFLAGVAATIALTVVFLEPSPQNHAVATVFASLFIVYAFVALASAHARLSATLARYKLAVRVYHDAGGQGKAYDLYEPLIDSILRARESICTVGLYRPATLVSSDARQKYYHALEEILQEKHRRRDRFTYERVLQVKRTRSGTLGANQVDPLTVEHCRSVLALQQQDTTVELRISQMPDVLNMLSFVIIDGTEVLLFVPSISQSSNGGIESTRLGTGIFFTDPDGMLAKEMLRLFNKLQFHANRITSIG